MHATTSARTKITKLSVLALATVAVTISAAGCSGGGTDKPADQSQPGAGSSARPKTTTSAPPKFTGVRHKLPTGKALTNDPDLYKTVKLTTCRKSDSGWQASGTAKYTGKQPAEIRVLVFFTDPQARAIDSAKGVVTAKPGETVSWHASRKFKAQKADCVVRAVAASRPKP